MIVPQLLQEELEPVVGRIRATDALSGGCISQAAKLTTANGEFVLKWSEEERKLFFEAEATGLLELEEAGTRVPEVLSFKDAPPFSYIILEYLPPARERDWGALAQMLAHQHQVHSRQFGFIADNFIGANPQVNTYSDSWSTFFVAERLERQIRFGESQATFSNEFADRFQSIKDRIISTLDGETTRPCLLHGDLWSGNVYWSEKGPALIDPAVYYGSPEADIAFTELFGGFPRQFYDTYAENNPFDEGVVVRKQIYNFYHLLNHANLFGGSYLPQCEAELKALTQIL